MKTDKYVIGIDFGTDSARAIIVDTINGNIVSDSFKNYPRWMEGEYCDAGKNMFRQHPQDYIDVISFIIPDALKKLPEGSSEKVIGISIDTTGSTPVLLNRDGVPLALTKEFEHNPNAMFVLWKDHTAVDEAEEINTLARKWHTDYTRYEGGIYSSEWVWSKVAHILRSDERVAGSAYSWAEHCDWMPALLTGKQSPEEMVRSRCAAGHKAMWHTDWDGLPDEEFLTSIEPKLAGYRDRLYSNTATADAVVGRLTSHWAETLGLNVDVVVGAGGLDCHFGAVGAEVKPNTLVRVIGTSTCDIMIAPYDELEGKLVPGICGQVDGSVLPGYVGLEAGQSAFGDLYAWFKDLLAWPLQFLEDENKAIDLESEILHELSNAAAEIPPGESTLLALDWINGRRTPDADHTLKASISGIGMGSTAPQLFKALVEATAFGSRAIMERFVENGIKIDAVTGIGGIAKKSPLVMQTLSDVMNVPIKVSATDETCAFGAAMFAAVAAGVYGSIEEAQQVMGQGFEKSYTPNKENAGHFDELYERYLEMGRNSNNL